MRGWTMPDLGAVGVVVLCTAVHGQSVPLPPAPVGVEVTTSYGIEFSTIVAGQQALPSPYPFTDIGGTFSYRPLGAVSASYRIARTETTTESWVSFLNTFANQTAPEWFTPFRSQMLIDGPYPRGAIRTTDTQGRIAWQVVSGLGQVPVGAISLPEVMMYCNWLHNNQDTSFESLRSGAYDIDAYMTGRENNQTVITRSASARYWIPSVDEWVRAAHFSPTSNTYWPWPTSPDRPAMYGPPGIGEANFGFHTYTGADGEEVLALFMPVASYANIQSPWGLFDTTGGVSEWTDTVLRFPDFESSLPGFVAIEGTASALSPFPFDPVYDRAQYFGYDWPFGGAGFRIAASIPSCGSVCGLATLFVVNCRRTRRAR